VKGTFVGWPSPWPPPIRHLFSICSWSASKSSRQDGSVALYSAATGQTTTVRPFATMRPCNVADLGRRHRMRVLNGRFQTLFHVKTFLPCQIGVPRGWWWFCESPYLAPFWSPDCRAACGGTPTDGAGTALCDLRPVRIKVSRTQRRNLAPPSMRRSFRGPGPPDEQNVTECVSSLRRCPCDAGCGAGKVRGPNVRILVAQHVLRSRR